VEELYGTYLTHLVFQELEKGAKSVNEIADTIGSDQAGRSFHNLKCRIRHSLRKMIAQGLVDSEWEITSQTPRKKYQLKDETERL